MIKSKEMIMFFPSSATERSICDRLRIPFITSVVFGNGNNPVYFGDLDKKEDYLEMIEEEQDKIKEERKKYD